MSTEEKELKRGVAVNLLGMLGQLCGPASLIVAARLYGADRLGVYLTSLALLDIAISFLTSGFRDAALLFVAKHSDGDGEDSLLYQSLANAIAWSLGCSILVLLATFSIVPAFLPSIESFSDEFVPMLQIMVLGVPLFSFSRIILAATQGLKIMKYEAIDGTMRAVSLFVFALVLWPLTRSSTGLAIAYVGSQLLSFAFSLYVFRRRFSGKLLIGALRSFHLHRELLRYALPQNLNMALNHFITQVDVLMLAYFGASPFQVGFYGAAARVVRELRRIRMVFSGALSPHIVVFYKRAKHSELSLLFSRTCGWISLIAIPAIIAVAALHPQVLQLISPEYVGDTGFVFVLLLLPYLDCCYGLAGNLVAMTGHSRINLLNSVVVGLSNVILNSVLIPEHGLLGAAVASAIASLAMTLLQLGEAHWLLGIPLRLSQMYRPHLAGASALLTGILSKRWLFQESGDAASQACWAVTMLVAFVATFLVLGGRFRRRP